MFEKILIANRGEIACRVLRTARRLGIHTIAVYSDADAHALHVALADEAVRIGPPPALESYLDIGSIIRAARDRGAEAIHPGYGFLAENGDFADACGAAGIHFIGPPAHAIRAMGSKSSARNIVGAAGVRLLPGYHGDNQAVDHLLREAQAIGFPVLLKPAAGGGGKGMRIVRHAGEFPLALDSARSEARGAFDSELMLIEKYLDEPRHVEIQIFRDHAGSEIYLGERDCSIQRRHQKVIEEAPAPGMTPRLRREMGEAALRCARAIRYAGAGTVEFLLDRDGTYYFMEMNTRLQVEHAVTEMTTGLDLVEWQLRIAAGEPLPRTQEEIACDGHAFEARIYAEDPDNGFLPHTGRLTRLEPPVETAHVRVDTGVTEGDEISVYYDPLIAKLIVWEQNRERALDRLAQALAEYRTGGIATNIPFLYNVARCEPFKRGAVETQFIEHHRELLLGNEAPADPRSIFAAALWVLLGARRASERDATAPDRWSPWRLANAWRLNEPHRQTLHLSVDRRPHEVQVEHIFGGESFLMRTGDHTARCEGRIEGNRMTATIEGHRNEFTIAPDQEGCILFAPARACRFHLIEPDLGEAEESPGKSGLIAPMNGTIVRLLAQVGECVEEQDPLLVLEAMKMEHTLRAPCPGRVIAFRCAPGDLVAGGATLVEFEPAPPGD